MSRKLNVIQVPSGSIWIEEGTRSNETNFWFFRGNLKVPLDIKFNQLGYLSVSRDALVFHPDETEQLMSLNPNIDTVDFLAKRFPDLWWVLDVHVDEHVRRQGIATQLYLTAIEYFGFLSSARFTEMEEAAVELWCGLAWKSECVSVKYHKKFRRYVGAWRCFSA